MTTPVRFSGATIRAISQGHVRVAVKEKLQNVVLVKIGKKKLNKPNERAFLHLNNTTAVNHRHTCSITRKGNKQNEGAYV